MIFDKVAAYNERVKLLGGFVNNLGLGLIAVGVLKPLVEGSAATEPGAGWRAADLLLSSTSEKGRWLSALADPAPGFLAQVPSSLYWLGLGVALHAVAHYVMTYMRKANP